MRQEILQNAGVTERIGWAFGLGLERIAMCLYDIPDIRLFWSTDSGFLNQFKVEDPNAIITYKVQKLIIWPLLHKNNRISNKIYILQPISIYPQCKNDISFWLPEDRPYSTHDFYDIVRNIGGDRIEQVVLKDEFTHPKTKRLSHCYTIVYRHMERTLSKNEVNTIHRNIARLAREKLHVEVR